MKKKFLFSFLALALILPLAAPVAPALAVDETKVCGIDGVTYDSAEAAEAAGVDVSYEFACVNPASEENLYENESDVHLVGMLVEIGSTDVPTTIIVRPNEGGLDVTVNVTAETVMGQKRVQYTNLSDWIPGDQIRVIGKNNENTNVVDATILVNHSIVMHGNLFAGANGWITAIDKEAKEVTYQWNNNEHKFTYDDDTRFVAAGKNPASVDDLEINDRIRGRLLKRSGETPYAKIVVVLRRGANLFMKIRTFRPNAVLTRLDSTVVPTTIQVKILNTPSLKANDVNNLIGTEGTLVTVNIDENTRIVRKYFGKTTLEEFSVGDHLSVVGRINDDGTVDAKMVKNNSIWKTSTQGHAGVVTDVNTEESYIMVNWTPIKQATNKMLRERLQEADNTVTAQSVNQAGTKQRIRNLIQNRMQTGTSTDRTVKYKKIITNRIQHSGLKLKDLVTRKPVKKIRVNITEDTRIVIGTDTDGTIEDIKNGDKVRIRGVRDAQEQIVTAETIVIVNSLPEIEQNLDTEIDDINEVVAEIVDEDGTGDNLVEDTTTDTEEEVDEEANPVDGSTEEETEEDNEEDSIATSTEE